MTRVTAFMANDKSLHLEEADQIRRDIELERENLDEHMSGLATVCSQRTRNRHIAAVSSPEDFKELLTYLFVHHRDMVDTILKSTDEGSDLLKKLRMLNTEEKEE